MVNNNEKGRYTVALLQIARKRWQEVKKASKDAQARANEAEGAMQSRYDTFKEEGQYLAGGLKIRCNELSETVTIIESIDMKQFIRNHIVHIYSVIYVEFEDGEESIFFMFPVLGGEEIEDGITVISPTSPIGNALMGKEEGETFQYQVNNRITRGEIVDVR